MSVLRFLRKTLALDYRSLGLYRILLGVIVIADVLYRLPDLTNFYTDIGLIPRSIFMSEMTMPWSFSLHFANGSFGFAALMFSIQLLIGVCLAIGYRTKWAMALAWIFCVSIHNRNWLVNNGGDDIMRAIFFISIFLPLNKRFSVDRALEKPRPEDEVDHFSTWTLTFFFQVFAIYFVSYILKDHAIWRKDFTGVFFSSRLDIFATPLGIWMRDWPFLQKLMTIFTVLLEWGGPLLLVFSFVFGKFWWIARTLTVVLFLGLHIGIIFTMWIGVFPYLCLVIWLCFLPTPLWDRLFKIWRDQGKGKLTLYFDQECAFCEKSVLILREFFLLPEVSVRPGQSSGQVYALMEKKNSWVVENEKGERFFYFEAMLELMRHSPLLKCFVPLLSTKLLSTFFNRFYLLISQNRPQMAKLSQFLEFRHPKKEIIWFSWAKGLFGAFILAVLMAWNAGTIKKWHYQKPRFMATTARWLHLYQEWNMFAPFPKMDNIWVEIPATLEDGSEIELLSGSRDVFSVKSGVFPGLVPNEHWRKFYLNLADRTDYAKYYAGFLCRSWNSRKIRWVPDQTLRKLEVIVYSQPNLKNGDKGGIKRKLSWRHWCFDEDLKKDNPKGL